MKKNIGTFMGTNKTHANPHFVLCEIWNVKRILSLFVCIFFGSILFAQNEEPGLPDPPPAVTIDGLLYKLYEDSHTAMIANVNSWEGELEIPEQVMYDKQTYTVNKIEWLAFDLCETLTKVKIPKTVTDIQHYAGHDACKNPFRGCTSLETIEVDEENPSMCSIDGVLFSKDKSKLYCYPAGAKAKSYNVPKEVTWIGGEAFARNLYLCTVEMPNSVTFMGYGVFSGCRNLESVRLSENLKYLDVYTFDNCESLHVLDIPKNVSGFAESVFRWTHLDALVVRGTFPATLRSDTFYFVDDSMIIYAQSSEVAKFKKVFSGKVLSLEDYEDGIKTGIIAPRSIASLINHSLFDLSGRCLSAPPTKGLYIKNGKIVVK